MQDVPVEVMDAGSGDPGFLVREDAEVVLLSAVCSHQGCLVEWAGDQDAFVCPCHRGTYSHTGAVLEGPPPRPLERLPVEVRDGQVYVVRA